MTFRLHAEIVDLIIAQNALAPLSYQLSVVLRGTGTFITSRSPTAKWKQTNVIAFIIGETCCSFLYLCGKINWYHLLPPRKHSTLRNIALPLPLVCLSTQQTAAASGCPCNHLLLPSGKCCSSTGSSVRAQHKSGSTVRHSSTTHLHLPASPVPQSMGWGSSLLLATQLEQVLLVKGQ